MDSWPTPAMWPPRRLDEVTLFGGVRRQLVGRDERMRAACALRDTQLFEVREPVCSLFGEFRSSPGWGLGLSTSSRGSARNASAHDARGIMAPSRKASEIGTASAPARVAKAGTIRLERFVQCVGTRTGRSASRWAACGSAAAG
jgi:hypothetical protein